MTVRSPEMVAASNQLKAAGNHAPRFGTLQTARLPNAAAGAKGGKGGESDDDESESDDDDDDM
jgi:hypothetical protein